MAMKLRISLATTLLASLSTAAIAPVFTPHPFLSQANAQLSDQEFQMGRAREACTAQAKQQGLKVNRVVSTVPVNGSGGVMIGSNVTLNVTRAGQTYDVRCDYTNSSKTAKISSLSSSAAEQVVLLCEGNTRQTARIYRSNGELKMRLFDRQRAQKWFDGPAVSETNPESFVYRNARGEGTYRVSAFRNERTSCSIAIENQPLERGTVRSGP